MSTEFIIKYDNARYPIRQLRPDGKTGCRGCGGELPRRRRSWCSDHCYTQYSPFLVLAACRKRDKGVCSICATNCAVNEKRYRKTLAPFRHSRSWRRSYRKTLPDDCKINYDHIIPFSEGGLTVAENIRTLCGTCHKARTKAWHAERTVRRREKRLLAADLDISTSSVGPNDLMFGIGSPDSRGRGHADLLRVAIIGE